MNKVYTRINWENYPSDKTPVNETNLNKLDYATDEIDDRVITLDTTKFDKTTAQTMVKDVSYDESTGIFTVSYLNGSTYTLDTKLEKLAINFDYDASTEQLIITLDDGTKQYVDLSALITEYEFLDSDIVLFTVDTDGKVSATIADGSITEDKLQTDYLAEIKVESAAAATSATNAATSAETATSKATAAANSASAASTSATNAATSANNASTSAANAADSATNAATSEANAEDYAILSESYAVGGTGTRADEDTDNAKYYATQAATSASNASTSASTATTKANAAATSATSAATSATSAATSATNAATSADEAETYATGSTDSAKYYYEQAKTISESFSGALRPMGTVTFANLPSLSSADEGDMYNVSDEFTTTSSFKEGSGYTIPAGSNVYKTSDGYWDVLAGSPVTGVKGNAETSYRKGNVNLTPANIGALASTTTYATSSSVGGAATYAATTADTTNALYPVGVTSSATTTLKRDTSVTISGGTVTATTFSGALSGNATTATSATKATQDGSGNTITSTYLTKSGDSASNTTTFTSGDSSTATEWTSVSTITSGSTHATLFNRLSTMAKNVRYLYNMLGTTDISSIGSGTVTSALSTLNNNLSSKITSGSTAGLAAIELSSATPYIDFHYDSSSSDYTSRIIETSSGTLTVRNNLVSSGTVNGASATEMSYLSGVTSNIQTQIDKNICSYTTQVYTISGSNYIAILLGEYMPINAYNGDWNAMSFIVDGIAIQGNYVLVWFDKAITGNIRLNIVSTSAYSS